jgi:hypothetical protein
MIEYDIATIAFCNSKKDAANVNAAFILDDILDFKTLSPDIHLLKDAKDSVYIPAARSTKGRRQRA